MKRTLIFVLVFHALVMVAGGHGAGPIILIELYPVSILLERSIATDKLFQSTREIHLLTISITAIIGQIMIVRSIITRRRFGSPLVIAGMIFLFVAFLLTMLFSPEYYQVTIITGIPYLVSIIVWIYKIVKQKSDNQECQIQFDED